jgi:hypothetical protein
LIDNPVTPTSDNPISTPGKQPLIESILATYNDLSPASLKNKLEIEKNKNMLINEALYNRVVLVETSRDLEGINRDIERTEKEIEVLMIRKDTAEQYAIIGRGTNPLAEDTYNRILKAINDKQNTQIKNKAHKEVILSRLALANTNTSGVNVNVANIVPGAHSSNASYPTTSTNAHQGIGDVDVFDM